MIEILKHIDSLPKQPIVREEIVFSEFWGLPDKDKERIVAVMRELQAIQKADHLGNEEYQRIAQELKPKGSELSGTPISVLEEKDLKRKQRKSKQEFKDMGLDKAEEMLVVANDMQFPDCDIEAVGAHLKFVKDNKDKITTYLINGDLIDHKMLSKFPKDDGEANERSEAEYQATEWYLSEITRLLPNTEKVWIFGNHDKARWENLLKKEGLHAGRYLLTIEELFKLEERGWKTIEYGQGQAFRFHDRLFYHGSRSGAKSNIGKMELEDAGVSVTTAHVNRNSYWENRDALGNLKSGISHGGFSKDNLEFVKKTNSGWSLGFGIYYWDKKVGEQPYMVVMRHNTGRFIAPDGTLYDGKGFKVGNKVK